MKHSYLTAGMTLGRLVSVILGNRLNLSVKNLSRLLFLFQSSLWSSIFAFIEDVRFSNQINIAPVPENPVFIIGHWRTGTTLLFKLMSMDEQFTAPTLFQVAEPDSMLTSYSYYKPIMKALVKKTRPMDNVKIGMDEPQEDEYAIYRLTGSSPLEELVFPCSKKYFVETWLQSGHSEKEGKLLKNQLTMFYKKVLYRKPGILLSKNPFHSFRIKLLREAFPGARFIQIHRNPCCVVPSTMNMWNILQVENSLNNMVHKHTAAEVSVLLKKLIAQIDADKAALPAGCYAEIKFEDLEKETVEVVRSLYASLGLEFTTGFEQKIRDYMESGRDFRKNSFSLPANDSVLIHDELKDHMQKYSYC